MKENKIPVTKWQKKYQKARKLYDEYNFRLATRSINKADCDCKLETKFNVLLVELGLTEDKFEELMDSDNQAYSEGELYASD
jgi:hypothetical protein